MYIAETEDRERAPVGGTGKKLMATRNNRECYFSVGNLSRLYIGSFDWSRRLRQAVEEKTKLEYNTHPMSELAQWISFLFFSTFGSWSFCSLSSFISTLLFPASPLNYTTHVIVVWCWLPVVRGRGRQNRSIRWADSRSNDMAINVDHVVVGRLVPVRPGHGTRSK